MNAENTALALCQLRTVRFKETFSCTVGLFMFRYFQVIRDEASPDFTRMRTFSKTF